MPLQNIDRIEIIRGPGAAVWGANAVNGVIYIITRPARELEGILGTAELSRSSGKALFQQGGSLGDRTQYRGFVSYIDRRALDSQSGVQAFDGSSLIRTGGRLDYQRSASQAISFLGDIYRGHLRQQVGPFLALPLENGGQEHDSILGGFAQGTWLISRGKTSTNVQSYFVNDTRNELASKNTTRTADVDIVSHRRTQSRVDLVWGGEARYTHDHVTGEATTQRPLYNNYLVSGFLQADVMLKSHVLMATFGTKVQTGTLVLAPTPHIAVDELYTNGFAAVSGGVEAAVSWKPREKFQVHASYGWTEAQTTQTGAGQVQLIDSFASAKNTASADLFWAVNRAWSINAQAYRVGNVPTPNAIVDVTTAGEIDGSVNHVAAFTRCDLNVKRKVGSSTVLKVGGTNLLQPRHLEFGSETSFLIPHYVPRSVFVRASWSF